MFRIILIIVTIVSIGISCVAFAEEGIAGESGGFLRLGAGVRAMGMGRAFCAIADDGSAIYWNPAGLGGIELHEFYVMYSMLTLDRTHNFLSYTNPHGKYGTIGVGILNFGVSNIDGRDNLGQPTGEFSDDEFAFQLAYGRSFYSLFSIGGGVKYIYQSLADYHASGYGFDFGALVNLRELMHLGFSISNIGGALKWNTASDCKDEIPSTMRAGAAFFLPGLPITLALDWEKTGHLSERVIFGGEYWFNRALGIRVGYYEQICAGASLRLGQLPKGLQFDYAYAQDDVLDENPAHRFGVSIRF